jgi:hypothetical protein
MIDAVAGNGMSPVMVAQMTRSISSALIPAFAKAA